jgi:hypothetical protein
VQVHLAFKYYRTLMNIQAQQIAGEFRTRHVLGK